MPPTPVDALPLVGAVPHDLSIIGLFLQSDAVVKMVMLILLVASFWSWAVIFDKVIRLRRLRFTAANFEETFWSGGSLDDLYERVGQRPPDPMSAVFSAAMREWRRSAAKNLLGTAVMRTSLQQRVERVMNVTVGREMERVERFMAYLATVGSTAPFVGLFGTVVGILNAFKGIESQKATGLSAVAGGIAEALVTTAFGLLVAVPAVWAYNYFTNKVEAFDVEMDNSSMELINYFITRRGGKK
jgi:biopolymer transport protein TolQ